MKYISTKQLKLLVMTSMCFNHIVDVFAPQIPNILVYIGETIGKVVFPIVAYLLVEGFILTSNIRRYVLRIALFWIISIIPYYLVRRQAFYSSFSGIDMFNNIFFTLLCGLLMLICISRVKRKYQKFLITCFFSLLTVTSDWPLVGVWIIFLYYNINSHRGKIIIPPMVLFVIMFAFGVHLALFQGHGLWALKHMLTYVGSFITIPILLKYDRSIGKPSPSMKWGSYVFYPTHLLALWGLTLIVT